MALTLLVLVAVQDTDYRYYVRSQPVLYYHEFNGLVYRGRVNEAGDFDPTSSFVPKPRKNMIFTGPTRFLREGGRKESVFEYRSGRLIPGVLDKEVFIPDLDGKISDFKTYRWSPTARRIYNLPGRFVTKLDFENLKAAKELSDEDLEFNKDR